MDQSFTATKNKETTLKFNPYFWLDHRLTETVSQK